MRTESVKALTALLALSALVLGLATPTRAAVFDLMAESEPLLFQLESMGALETSDKSAFRWAFGPSCSIRFRSSRATTAILRMAYKSPVAGQSMTVSANGAVLREVKDIPFTPASAPPMSLDVELPVKVGDNVITLVFGDWNHGKSIFVQVDDRPFALGLTGLSLEFGAKPAQTSSSVSRFLDLLWSHMLSGDWYDFQAGKGSGLQAVTGVSMEGGLLQVFGKNATALFSSRDAGEVELSFSMRSELNRFVTVWANGVLIARPSLDAEDGIFKGVTVRFPCVAGLNEVSLRLDNSELPWSGLRHVPGRPSAEIASFSCQVSPAKSPTRL